MIFLPHRSIKRCIQISLAAALVSFFCPRGGAAETTDYLAWRANRLERLTASDGWLTLVGLHWLAAGDQSVGSGEDNRLVLTKGPRRLGLIRWDPKVGAVAITLAADTPVTIDGAAASGTIKLNDSDDAPTLLKVDTLLLQVISRGDRKALRVKDSSAQTRAHFTGIDYFDENPAWRVTAKWETFSPARTVKIQNIVGTISDESVPGKAVFERDGNIYELWPIQEAGDDGLFFIFSDQTSGKETYGAGRFLFTDASKDGKVVLDFNRAVNPPCAFTAFATCPLPPRQNRLATRVLAGEKSPRDHP